MSCPCDTTTCGETLPTAGLEGVAEQIRKEFAEQPGGPAPVDPPAPPRPVRKKISQETFDEVVDENVEEFAMDLDEAMRDACAQFEQQGVDISALVTTVEGREKSEQVKVYVAKLDELLKAEEDGDLVGLLEDLSNICRAGDVERVTAGKLGAVGAAAFVCKKHVDDKRAVVAALNFLGVVLKTFDNREIIPLKGAQALQHCLEQYKDCPVVQSAGFSAITQAISKHEGNKRAFKDVGINTSVLTCLHAHQESRDTFIAVSRFLRVYLSDDDRRPGVSPGTFTRARELGEDYEAGAVRPLVDFVAKEGTLSDEKLVSASFATIKAVAVNDLICKQFANKGGLEVALLAFEAHITDETVAANGCMLLKAVTRNDDIKRTVGKGKGLGLLLRALDEHMASSRVVEQALACLSVLCLRQPGNCETIANLGCLQLIISSMTRHADIASVQRPAICTLRNMVSSWQNKELCSRILDEGAEPLIRKAKNTHPICDDVAFAALRDLGCDYHS
mmetsp:Transcript_14951/g.23495  ORF Transcript_14951/g.23495 Transcript_14951/m.23495 type:complete len:505 (+) Transcript_14951:87-1601(+)